jgi:hypothetical protein
MNSSTHRRSTRAATGQPRPTSFEARRKAQRPKSSRLRAGTDVNRGIEGRHEDDASEQPNPTHGGRELHAGAPVKTALGQIQDDLEVIRSCVTVVARALEEQDSELDHSAADVLIRHVRDALTQQMIRLGLPIHGGAS